LSRLAAGGGSRNFAVAIDPPNTQRKTVLHESVCP
jgi:hypothetical protein